MKSAVKFMQQPYRRHRILPQTVVRKTNNADLWWINPIGFLTFIILPLFVLSTLFGGEVMGMFGSLNFLSLSILWTGVACLSALMVGLFGGASLASSYAFSKRDWHEKNLVAAIRVLLLISLLAHFLLLATVLVQPDLLLSALSGARGAASHMRKEFGRIPFVTTLTQLYLIAVPLYVAYPFLFKRRLPRDIDRIFLILVGFVFLRALLGSERLALIEFAICYFLPKIAYSTQRKYYAYLPPVAILGVFVFFAGAEYFRTWAAYKAMYSSYLEFVSYRFFGYFCTSTNNAAGIFSNFGPIGEPWFTTRWMRRLTLIFSSEDSSKSILGVFFQTYGNSEFTNPSGILAPVLDFGRSIGAFIWVLIGFLGGMMYLSFRKMKPLGVLLYPSFFLGFADITQVLYWGEPRYIPVVAIFIPVFLYITKRKRIS